MYAGSVEETALRAEYQTAYPGENRRPISICEQNKVSQGRRGGMHEPSKGGRQARPP